MYTMTRFCIATGIRAWLCVFTWVSDKLSLFLISKTELVDHFLLLFCSNPAGSSSNSVCAGVTGVNVNFSDKSFSLLSNVKLKKKIVRRNPHQPPLMAAAVTLRLPVSTQRPMPATWVWSGRVKVRGWSGWWQGEYSLLMLPASALMLFRPTVAPARPCRVPSEVREFMAPALELAVVPAAGGDGKRGTGRGGGEPDKEWKEEGGMRRGKRATELLFKLLTNVKVPPHVEAFMQKRFTQLDLYRAQTEFATCTIWSNLSEFSNIRCNCREAALRVDRVLQPWKRLYTLRMFNSWWLIWSDMRGDLQEMAAALPAHRELKLSDDEVKSTCVNRGKHFKETRLLGAVLHRDIIPLTAHIRWFQGML